MKLAISVLAAGFLLVCSSVSAQQKSLENLLTNETVFVWSWSGEQATSEAYQLTASYKAFHESGLLPAFAKLGDSIPWTQLVAASSGEFPFSWSQLKLAWSHVRDQGAAVSVGIRGDDAQSARPYGLLVIPEAGAFAPAIEKFYYRMLQSELGESDAVAQFDLSGFEFPAIQLPIRTPWQALSGLVPQATYSGQTTPSAYYLSDDISYYPPPSQPAPSVAPAGSPYQSPTGYNSPALSPAAPPTGYAQPQPVPIYSSEASLPQNPGTYQSSGYPQVAAATTLEEPLAAPRPTPSQTPEASWKVEEILIGKRSVYHLSGVVDPDVPNVHFAWWAEGDDLVFYYGMSPVAEYLEGLQEQDTQLVHSELWQSAFETATVARGADKLTETSRVWLNLERITQLFADIPIPGIEPATTVRKLVEPTGLLGLRSIGGRSGYRGQNLVSITRVVTESPRQGLLSLLDDSTFTLDDLPPLPANVSSFSARTIDLGKSYQEAETLIEQYFKLGGAEGMLAWQMIKQQAIGSSSFDLERDLLSHLGQVVVTYDDSEQEIIGWGNSAVAIAVTDPEALLAGINRWRDSVNESFQTDFRILRRERRGYTIFALAGRNSFVSPSFAVSGNWLVIGWQPQTVEAFQLRAAKKLPVWSPDELSSANRDLLPQKFQHLEYSDPRSTVRTMVSLAPWALEGIRWYADQASEAGFVWNPGVSSLDIPPAELIVGPLYPNLSVTTHSDKVIHTERWASSNVDNSVLWFIGAYFGLGLLAG